MDLQHKEGTSIVLVPQPTRNDPNDPLVRFTILDESQTLTQGSELAVQEKACGVLVCLVSVCFVQLQHHWNCPGYWTHHGGVWLHSYTSHLVDFRLPVGQLLGLLLPCSLCSQIRQASSLALLQRSLFRMQHLGGCLQIFRLPVLGEIFCILGV